MRAAARRLAPVVALAAALAASSCAEASRAEPRPRRETPAAKQSDTHDSPAASVAAPAETPAPPDEAAQRAARLGLGTKTSIVHLFVGPAPEEWVREAGGTEPPPALAWPLDGGRWLRGYGDGRGGSQVGQHRGIDVADDAGAPIHAAADGIVGYAGHELSGYGNVVVLIHSGGWVTLYGHASELVARSGQRVARGDVIARVGHTGNAGGDHLHFELRRDGNKVNPIPFLTGVPARVRAGNPMPLPANARVYRVKRADRLTKIARGSGMTLQDLAALNGLDKRDVLTVGHRLLIVHAPRANKAARPRRGRRR